MLAAGTTLGMAQQHAADVKSINKTLEEFNTSWNNHNFSDIASYTTEDCDWVNVVGMWWQGRDQVKYAHQTFHNGMFKNTPLTTLKTDIRFITPDVAVVHILNHVGAYYPPDGIDHGGNKAGDDDNISLLVLVKKQGTWLITTAENVPVNAHAVRSNPVLNMNK